MNEEAFHLLWLFQAMPDLQKDGHRSRKVLAIVCRRLCRQDRAREALQKRL